MTDQQPHGPGGPGTSGSWQPVPGGGDYDPDQTMHVSFAAQLPPEPRPGEDPLSAHGPVGPGANHADPAATWTIPVIRDDGDDSGEFSGEYTVGSFTPSWDQAPSPAAPTQSFPAGLFGQGAAAAAQARAQNQNAAERPAAEAGPRSEQWTMPYNGPEAGEAVPWLTAPAPAQPAEAAWTGVVDDPDSPVAPAPFGHTGADTAERHEDREHHERHEPPGGYGAAYPSADGGYPAPGTGYAEDAYAQDTYTEGGFADEPHGGYAEPAEQPYAEAPEQAYREDPEQAYADSAELPYPEAVEQPYPEDGGTGFVPLPEGGYAEPAYGEEPAAPGDPDAAAYEGPEVPEEAADAGEAFQGEESAAEGEDGASEGADGTFGPGADGTDPEGGFGPEDAVAEGFQEYGEFDAEEEPEPEPVEESRSEHPLASYTLRVNGTDRPVTDAWLGESLLYVLRERLGLAGAKDGCEQGECGACSVQVDGRLVASCLVPAATAAGSEVRTVEGLTVDGRPSDVQRALADCGAVQCGFCIPGMAMTVHDLLEGNHRPTDLDVRHAVSGNLCRCSGYRGVIDAVRQVVAERGAESEPAADDPARIPHQGGPAGGVL